jgi:hypothetical protein
MEPTSEPAASAELVDFLLLTDAIHQAPQSTVDSLLPERGTHQ